MNNTNNVDPHMDATEQTAYRDELATLRAKNAADANSLSDTEKSRLTYLSEHEHEFDPNVPTPPNPPAPITTASEPAAKSDTSVDAGTDSMAAARAELAELRAGSAAGTLNDAGKERLAFLVAHEHEFDPSVPASEAGKSEGATAAAGASTPSDGPPPSGTVGGTKEAVAPGASGSGSAGNVTDTNALGTAQSAPGPQTNTGTNADVKKDVTDSPTSKVEVQSGNAFDRADVQHAAEATGPGTGGQNTPTPPPTTGPKTAVTEAAAGATGPVTDPNVRSVQSGGAGAVIGNDGSADPHPSGIPMEQRGMQDNALAPGGDRRVTQAGRLDRTAFVQYQAITDGIDKMQVVEFDTLAHARRCVAEVTSAIEKGRATRLLDLDGNPHYIMPTPFNAAPVAYEYVDVDVRKLRDDMPNP